MYRFSTMQETARKELETWFEREYDGDDYSISDQVYSIAEDNVPDYAQNRIEACISANLLFDIPEIEPREMTLNDLAGSILLEELENYLNTLVDDLKQEWDTRHEYEYHFDYDGIDTYKAKARDFILLRRIAQPEVSVIDLWLDFQLEIPMDLVSDPELAQVYFEEIAEDSIVLHH